jgi:2-C-methyl-D-erythritol 4-phosphate cytidylyltransferase
MVMPPGESGKSARTQTAVLLLAAGSSRRMGDRIFDKCLFPVCGKCLLNYAYEAFQALGDWGRILIVYRDAVQRSALEAFFPSPTIVWIAGGATRSLSVWNALEYLQQHASATQWVLIHDGARPYVSPQLIENVFCAMLAHGNAIPAKEITDTLVQRDDLSCANCHYPDRNHYFRIETPQGFSFPLLYRAYASPSIDLAALTDDSALYQTQSPLHFVIHRMKNDKMTWAEDLQSFLEEKNAQLLQ